jgi:hypothetical protein
MDGLSEWVPEMGTPQGAVIAPPTILQTREDFWIDGSPGANFARSMAKGGTRRDAVPISPSRIQQSRSTEQRHGTSFNQKSPYSVADRRSAIRLVAD